jgi:CDGSH-type Zn-finger protein
VTPVTTRRGIAHNRPFCDGHHIVEVKTAIWVYVSKWG